MVRIMKPANNDPIYEDKEDLRESKKMWTGLLEIMKSVGFSENVRI